MIKLTKQLNYLNFEDELTLETILKNVISCHYTEDIQYPGIYIHNRYGSCINLKINCATGNATLETSSLLYYPSLIRQLRKVAYYPVYTINIFIDKIDGVRESGIAETIKALQSLDEILATYRKEKIIIDTQINNLIMLYGQQKEKPIYNGSKPFYKREYNYKYKEYCRLVFISGIKYFTPSIPSDVYLEKYYKQKSLYILSGRELLKEHQEKNIIEHNQYIDNRFAYSKGLVGGIINTPILIFRCAPSSYCKGKHYYLDLHENKILKTLAEARSVAKAYAGNNYKIDVWEEKG